MQRDGERERKMEGQTVMAKCEHSNKRPVKQINNYKLGVRVILISIS
jgi:hypothetical protein